MAAVQGSGTGQRPTQVPLPFQGASSLVSFLTEFQFVAVDSPLQDANGLTFWPLWLWHG